MKALRFSPALGVMALLLATGSPAASDAESGLSPVTTVSRVDLARYAGRWYEVARIPNRFQNQCARGTTAEYTVQDDGRVVVENRCVKKDGALNSARGIARIVEATGNAQLKVSFVSFLGWRPFWGDYWVVGLDPDYRWAAVGSPDRKYGWILSRTPELDDESLEKAFTILDLNGFQRSVFEMSLP